MQGPARPAPSPAVSADLLRMKPTHLRVHRPGGVNRVSNRPGGGAGAGAAGAGARAGASAVGRGGVARAGGGALSVPRPAGAAFLTPRGARLGAAGGAGR